MEPCHVCAGIDLSLPHTVNALNLGVSEAAIRRHRAHMSETKDTFFDIPNAIITSRGKTVRLLDGSYEKVTWSPAKAALLEAMSYDDIERAIEGYTYQPAPTNVSPVSTHLLAADWQVGKVDRDGGTPELTERILTSFHKAAERIKELKPQEIFLYDLGDVIENFQNTSSQRQTNDMNLTGQIRAARRLMAKGLLILAPLAPKITYVSVPSNHCEVRLGPKSPASTPEDDFGVELGYQLEDKFEGRPEFSHIRFVRPEPLSEALTVTTLDGVRIGAVHGHQAGAWHSVSKWWEGQSHGRRNGLDQADILLAGHWHSHTRYQSGDKRWVVIGSTSDNGSSWYDNKTGKTATSGMVYFTVKGALELDSMTIL